jgi:hypothetical protein
MKTGKSFEFSRPWSKFSKIRQTKKFIFLFIPIEGSSAFTDAQVIKKSAFKSSEQLKDFLQFTSEKIGKK